MSAALRSAGLALRQFLRGFLGLASAPPRDPQAARDQLCREARGRDRCC
jgi:hypothetical protein